MLDQFQHWGFLMSKYSKNFKLHVVQDYLTSSLGYKLIAQKYHIKSDTTVMKWVKQYETLGLNGLSVKRPQKVYDGTFKLDVLNWLKLNKASLYETALHFYLSEPSTIWLWQRKMESEGPEALFKTRGRPTIMTAKKQSKKDPKKSELERLKEENELLKIENDYLKKLRALVQSQPDKEHKSSQN